MTLVITYRQLKRELACDYFLWRFKKSPYTKGFFNPTLTIRSEEQAIELALDTAFDPCWACVHLLHESLWDTYVQSRADYIDKLIRQEKKGVKDFYYPDIEPHYRRHAAKFLWEHRGQMRFR